jgi:hypothetical protein
MAKRRKIVSDSSSYKGDTSLKGINENIEWTEELLDEYTRCATDIKYFIETYVRIENVDDGLVHFKLRDYQHRMVDGIMENRFSIMLCSRQVGKALSLDTPILTKNGFKTVADISVGDFIYGKNGKLTKVTFITEIMNDRPCFQVVFDNGESIIADAEHQWNFNIGNSKTYEEKTITTQEVYDYIQTNKNNIAFTDVSKEIEFKEIKFKLDPYSLGVMVGDVNVSLNYIPKNYIFSSINQRLELLTGLMDAGGNVSDKGVCEYSQSNKQLINDIRLILSTLGIKSKITEKRVKGQSFYTIIFSTSKYNVFKSIEKLTKQQNSKNNPKSTRLYIKSITPAESVPVRCLTVDNDDHMFLCGNTLVPTHNSTVTAGVSLHQALFRSHYKVAMLANKNDLAKELLDRVKIAYRQLPKWLQQGVVKFAEHEIVLENGSKIIAKPTSKTAIRGKSINLLVLDEFAHVPNHIADEFYAATYPTISSGKTTKLVIISTPNRINLFYKLWTDSVHKRNSFFPIKVSWREVPGRDEEWRKNEISNTSQEQFNQEHELSFESGSDGLISSEKIIEMLGSIKEPTIQDRFLNIYENPQPNEKYLISVDTAKGVQKDYSAFTIIKITKIPYEVVGVYRNNEISPLIYPEIIKNIAINYNKADLLIENNEYGAQIASSLIYEYEYDNVIWTYISQNKQRINYGNDGSNGSLPGVRTTQAIKKIGCSNLKALIENNKLKIFDFQAITELSTFVRKGDTFQASESTHDDVTMCLVLFGWLTTQDYFKNLDQHVGEDIRSLYQEEINNNMLHFGFILNGSEADDDFIDDEDALDKRYGWSKIQETDFEDLSHFFKL